MTSFIFNKEIEFVVKNFLTKKIPGVGAVTGELYFMKK